MFDMASVNSLWKFMFFLFIYAIALQDLLFWTIYVYFKILCPISTFSCWTSRHEWWTQTYPWGRQQSIHHIFHHWGRSQVIGDVKRIFSKWMECLWPGHCISFFGRSLCWKFKWSLGSARHAIGKIFFTIFYFFPNESPGTLKPRYNESWFSEFPDIVN